MTEEALTEEPTWEQRAARALATLAETMPTGEEVALEGKPFPDWMTSSWLPPLTDPADPKFTDSVLKAEAWLASH
jgi:hypothetical protein